MIQLTQYSFSSVFIKLKRNVTKRVRCGSSLTIWLKWRHLEEKIEKDASYKCNHHLIARKLKTWSSLNIIWRTWFYYQDINVWPRLATCIPKLNQIKKSNTDEYGKKSKRKLIDTFFSYLIFFLRIYNSFSWLETPLRFFLHNFLYTYIHTYIHTLLGFPKRKAFQNLLQYKK